MALNIDPNAPTREEMIAHNMKVAKANLASDIVRALAQRLPLIPDGDEIHPMTAKEAAEWAISASETILETYTLMPNRPMGSLS